MTLKILDCRLKIVLLVFGLLFLVFGLCSTQLDLKGDSKLEDQPNLQSAIFNLK